MSRSFVVKLPNREQDNTGGMKKQLIDEILRNRPYLSDDCTSCATCPLNKRNISYAGPGDGIFFGANQYNPTTRYYSPYDLSYCPASRVQQFQQYPPYTGGPTVYDLYTQYEEAMQAINNYSRNKLFGFTNPFKKSYDFMLYGQPVSVNQHYIQIGSDIIPIGMGRRDYFYSLPVTQRVTIVTTIVKIRYTIVGL